ncbi:hypothetical protein CVT25_001078 [Psilocybe cyanescens]|uniref:RlpA-like protein double-psi beta-barrel domain-containing protein n=1 Tax=Psilocybe cyanescens TaxID=93625 RepID=A0A409XB31_PSICY|nr:hypothetical protein CVT25_001078 [Psilocybe cyanescens]
MQHLSAFTVALSLALSVSSLVVPRATPPAGWNTPLLEPYDTYHDRYMALSCNTKHNSAFFDQCCHPLLATQSLTKDRPAQCIPAASSSAAAAKPSSTSSDDDDDDLPFCDDDGDDDDNSAPHVSSSPAKAPAPTTTHAAAPATTTAVAAPKPVVTSAKPAPAKPAVTPSTNSASSTVETGGFATFFFQNGVAGACGTVHKDTDMIAAMDQDRYGFSGNKSPLCGKQVKITNTKNQKTVVVTVADDCPTCVNSNSIDLSQGAFEKIATVEEGMVPSEHLSAF